MKKNKPLLREVWDYLKVRKKWWLIPIIVFLLLIAALIIASQSSTVPVFIYALG